MRLPVDRKTIPVLMVVALAALIMVAGQSRASRLSADFTIDYSAGVMLREGRFTAPYDQHQLGAMLEQLAPNGAIDPSLPYNKPLAAALPYALLSLLPLELAFRVWQAVSAGLLLATLLLLQRVAPLGSRGISIGLLGLVTALPTADTFDEGQITTLLPLGAALLIAGLRWKRMPLAVAGGALLAIKPQYLPAYLIACLAARDWRLMIAAAIGGALVLLSPLVGGADNLLALAHQAGTHVNDVRFNEAWIGLIAVALPGPALATAAIALFVAAHAALTVLAWRRPRDLLPFVALAGTVGVLASPHALPHDLLVLAVPAWLAGFLYRAAAIPNPIAALVAVDLALVIDLLHRGAPLAPLVMTVALAWMVWEFRRRAESQARQPQPAQAA